jgi:dolichol-phosphate mannosyltransferase
MPVHNEGPSIAQSLREWHAELSPFVDLRFSVAEDGSTDNTKEVLRALAAELPMLLDIANQRRGYAGGMIAALRATESEFVLTSDSDGQSDPKSFWALWNLRGQHDLIVGWRVNRADSLRRKIMSGSFKTLHRLLFRTSLNDPSCNVMLIKRSALEVLLPRLGTISEGFQWELIARAKRAGLSIAEVAVNHRARASGSSDIFRPSRILSIAVRNGLGLLRIWATRK